MSEQQPFVEIDFKAQTVKIPVAVLAQPRSEVTPARNAGKRLTAWMAVQAAFVFVKHYLHDYWPWSK